MINPSAVHVPCWGLGEGRLRTRRLGCRWWGSVWSFAPSREEAAAALRQGAPDPHKVVAVVTEGQVPPVDAVATYTYKPADSAADMAANVAAKVKELGAGASVTIAAPATVEADLVKELQAAAVQVPLLLSVQALTPAFAQRLAGQGGVVSASLATSGVNTSDSVALQSTDEGRSMSAYLKAISLMSSDSSAQNLTKDQDFRAVAPYADSRAHDAALALAYAAAHTDGGGSVAGTLGSLRLRAGSAEKEDAFITWFADS